RGAAVRLRCPCRRRCARARPSTRHGRWGYGPVPGGEAGCRRFLAGAPRPAPTRSGDTHRPAESLRSRRGRVTPSGVGLPAGRRRRTPGLRRDEVARLAAISTEYYTRLEQARGPHPSREVVRGLATALRLSDAERIHLHE